ncbi:MAG: glycosyltransferase family 2 protein [Pseudomonadota bacterium]
MRLDRGDIEAGHGGQPSLAPPVPPPLPAGFGRRLFKPMPDDAALAEAVAGLSHRRPAASAYHGLWAWQFASLLLAMFLAVAGAVLNAAAAIALLLGTFTAVFFAAIALRTVAMLAVLDGRRGQGDRVLPDVELPTYAVLVPVVFEAAIAPDLIAALNAIDYPHERLDIILICEARDPGSVAALADAGLGPAMRILVVPDCAPRTKPKALNYALAGVTADYVVIYDAEDCPAPDQLRRAAARFRAGPADLGCLQAQLNIYNWRESWLTRQFTLEYSGLFDALLPALQRLALPIPLGGTSNHFPRAVLQKVGAWDPWNVTEDADLGFRLARAGYRIGVLPSTTWEEAPSRWGAWLKQRTRWIKGWLQTYAVHNREPLKLLRELGLYRFIGFQLLVGGLLAAIFCHPIFYAMIAYELAQPQPFAAETGFGRAVWAVSGINFVAGVVTTVAVSAAAVTARRRFGLLRSLVGMPVYWLMISLAGYRALFQVITNPSGWEKTKHRARTRRDDLPDGMHPRLASPQART